MHPRSSFESRTGFPSSCIRILFGIGGAREGKWKIYVSGLLPSSGHRLLSSIEMRGRGAVNRDTGWAATCSVDHRRRETWGDGVLPWAYGIREIVTAGTGVQSVELL